MELKYIKTFCQSENVDTKTIFQQMMSKSYGYIMATEHSVNPNTPHILVGNNQESLYFHNNPNRRYSLSAESILLERIDARFFTYQNLVTGVEITDAFNVPHWFQKPKTKFSMLTRFTYIIHSIIPLTKNERDFSLASIYTALLRANISVEILYGLIFVNRNSTALVRNTPIDVFGGSLDAVDNIFDEMESNPYAFADARDSE